jgi:hypothetical protein
LATLDSVSVTLVSHTRSSGQQWPFVVIPDFALRMSKVLPVSDAFVISVLPLVTPEIRDEWEAFSIQNDSWVDESIAFQETWSGYHGPVIYGGEKKGVVHGDFDDIPRNSRSVPTASLLDLRNSMRAYSLTPCNLLFL